MTKNIGNPQTIVEDSMGNSHTFYPLQLKDMDKLREFLPKVDTNLVVINVLNVDADGMYNDEAYEAMLELIRLAIREPEATREDIEEWLDVRIARVAVRILLALPM